MRQWCFTAPHFPVSFHVPILHSLSALRSVIWCMVLYFAVCSLSGAASAEQRVQLAVLMPATLDPAPVMEQRMPEPDPIAEIHPARRALESNPIHDASGSGYTVLQRLDQATSHMQHDALGFPDWMAALRSGQITPLPGLTPTSKMNVLDLDVVMKNTKGMPYVRFPHRSHTLWLDCSNCHPAPFTPLAGANPVSMNEIFRGKYCGMCHDRVAFITFYSCIRCHSVAQDPALSQ